MRYPVLLAMAALITMPALAGELAGVKMPDQIEVEGTTLVLNGLGLREATFLKVDVYVAGLYLEEKSTDPDAIIHARETKRMVMKFVRNVAGKDLVKAWTEGFEKNAGGKMKDLKERLDVLNSWMGDVASGDEMVFTYLPAKGVEVEIRGEMKGVISGDDFAAALWSVWLGPTPPNPGLKEGLLGKS